jgi:hypothetical protein
MATSPSFNWPEPDNTDLVKNGALAIRTAVDAIDTSMTDLLGGTTGQVLSKTSNTDMDFTWVAQDDSNAIQNAIVDAKGDIIAASANDTPARLAVGADGLLLTAASGEATGLKYTGAWTSYTPTWSNLTVGNGSLIAKYCLIGKVVFVTIELRFGSTTSISGFVNVTMPIVPIASVQGLSNIIYEDAGIGFRSGTAALYAFNNTAYLAALNTSGTYGTSSDINATVPFTWTTNDGIYFSACYEVA